MQGEQGDLEALGAPVTHNSREFAGYRLMEVLGGGRASAVYRALALDEAAGPPSDKLYAALTEYAIKVLRESDGIPRSRANFRARFYREAEIASALRHPHIIPVFEYGEWQGLPYMVMSHATGGSLRKWIASQPGQLALSDAAAYAMQLASALDFAHQRGIVHRDVKPSNALLDGQGRLLLADFGLARHYARSAWGDDSGGEATTLTSTGEVFGTPSYMAPEQLQGQRVGPAADIYALGVVLYLLVTGRLPFVGETPLAVGMAHLRDTPLSPQLLRPDLPVPAAAAILCALAKDPAQRFGSAGDLASAFASGIEGSWTAENRARARIPERDLTEHAPARWWSAPVLPWRPAGALRKGMVVLAAVAVLGSGIATTQAVQNIAHSVTMSVVNSRNKTAANASEPITASTNRGGVGAAIIRYNGAQVYALWPDGSRRWTVWLDAAASEPPQLLGNVVYVTTVDGTRYTLSASDGAILARVAAPVTTVSQPINPNNPGNPGNPGRHHKHDQGHGHGHDGKDD